MPQHKRGRGEGTIHKIRPTLWMGRISLPNNTRRSVYGKTRAAVVQKLRDLTVQRVTTGSTAPGTATVATLIDQFLDSKRPTLRRSSFQTYESLLRQHVAPLIGSLRAADLDSVAIDRTFRDLQTSGATAATAKNARKRLSAAFRHGIKKGLVARNPVTDSDPIRHQAPEMAIYTEDQIARLFAATAGSPLRAMFYLAALCGPRASELLGLTWSHIDLHARTATIAAQLYIETIGDSTTYELQPLKTKNSHRTIALPDLLVPLLQERRQLQNEARLRAGRDWIAPVADLVFTMDRAAPHGPGRPGRPVRRDRFRKIYYHHLNAAHLHRLPLHALRHTAASLYLSKTQDVHSVSRMLGHSGINITIDTYGHLLRGRQHDNAAAVNAIFATI